MSSNAKIAIVGCGRMGRGIALLAAQNGVGVYAVAGREGGGDSARQRFEKDRAKLCSRKGEDAGKVFDHIEVRESIEDVPPCAIWVETVREDFETKERVLARIEAHAGEDALIGTNTSSLPLEELAARRARPARFLALHFFNPPTRMKLVEVGLTSQTSPRALADAKAFCESLGQVPIEVQGVPGYLVNRLLVPQLLHAIETLEAGVASIEAIDAAMQLGVSHPMGPLALADYIGLDIVLAMAKTMREELDDPRFDPPRLLVQLVDQGKLGRKTGAGFYRYEDREPQPNREVMALAS